MATKSKLGDMLVKEKLLTEAQLKTAVDMSKSTGGTLAVILVKLGMITDDKLTEFIAKKVGMSVADIDNMVLPENLIKRVPRKLLEDEQVVPIAFRDGVLVIATSDPTDLSAGEKIAFATGYKVEMQLASRRGITRAMANAFQAEEQSKPSGPKSKEQLLRDLSASMGAKPSAKEDVSQTDLRRALVPLLIEKGVITEAELRRKAEELAAKGVEV